MDSREMIDFREAIEGLTTIEAIESSSAVIVLPVLYCASPDLSRSDQKCSDLLRFQPVLLRSDQNLSSSEQNWLESDQI